jgi:hypothetical protein
MILRGTHRGKGLAGAEIFTRGTFVGWLGLEGVNNKENPTSLLFA